MSDHRSDDDRQKPSVGAREAGAIGDQTPFELLGGAEKIKAIVETFYDAMSEQEPGVWVLGLMCSSCQNPAPVVLSVLQPGAAP